MICIFNWDNYYILIYLNNFMTQHYTMDEAIKRYGGFMHDFGELKEKRRIVEAAGIYAEFPEALDVLDRIKTYRELTGENFPQILEVVNPDLNELERLCLALQI